MENMQSGFKVLGKYFLCVILCFFTFFSFAAIFSMMDNTKDAYTATVYELKEVETYTYNEADGDDKKKADFEAKGYLVKTDEKTEGGYVATVYELGEEIDAYVHEYTNGKDNKKADYEKQGYLIKTAEFNILQGGPFIVYLVIAQTVSLIFFVIMVPREVYRMGSRDINRVSRGEVREDKLRGLKIGLVPSACSLFSYVCLLLFKCDLLASGHFIYQYFNYYSFGYQTLIFGGDPKAPVFSTLSMVLAFLPVLLPAIVCWAGYLLGYKDINLYEKTVYKKKKEEN